MNWDAIGAIAEMLGGVGVIVTLVYLAHQIRQNTESNRTSVIQLTSEQETAFWTTISNDEQVAEILIRGNRDLRSLSEVESARYAAVMMQLYRFWEKQLELHMTGVIPPGIWESALLSMRASLSNPGVRSWWRHTKHIFTESLQSIVDEQIGKITSSGNPTRIDSEA